jgi:hypothetical protein
MVLNDEGNNMAYSDDPVYGGLSGTNLIKAIQANNGLSMVGADGKIIPQTYKPSVVAQTTQAASPIASATNYTFGSNAAGKDLASDNAGWDSMSAELTKPAWADPSAQMATQATTPHSYLSGAWDRVKSSLGFGETKPTPTFAEYTAGGGKSTEAQWQTGNNDAMRNENQQFANYAGAGMGAVQTGLGVLSYFDNKAMNKKNMQLIDQQIANNQDVMKTRTERAGDIKKYFG